MLIRVLFYTWELSAGWLDYFFAIAGFREQMLLFPLVRLEV